MFNEEKVKVNHCWRVENGASVLFFWRTYDYKI